MAQDNNAIKSFLNEQYGIQANDIKTLYAYEDVNIKVTSKTQDYFVKIHQYISTEQLNAITNVMDFLAQHGVPITLPKKNNSGALWCDFHDKPCIVQNFVEGQIVTSDNLTADVAFDIGQSLGKIHKCAQREDFPAFHHPSMDSPWYPQNFNLVIQHADDVADKIPSTLKASLTQFFDYYHTHKESFTNLAQGFIHTDFNRENILLSGNKIQSIIDFSDATNSYFVADIGTALFYLFAQDQPSWPQITHFWEGYTQHNRLPAADLKSIPLFTQLRAITSLVENLKDHNKISEEAKKAIEYLNSDAHAKDIFSFLNK